MTTDDRQKSLVGRECASSGKTKCLPHIQDGVSMHQCVGGSGSRTSGYAMR